MRWFSNHANEISTFATLFLAFSSIWLHGCVQGRFIVTWTSLKKYSIYILSSSSSLSLSLSSTTKHNETIWVNENLKMSTKFSLNLAAKKAWKFPTSRILKMVFKWSMNIPMEGWINENYLFLAYPLALWPRFCVSPVRRRKKKLKEVLNKL